MTSAVANDNHTITIRPRITEDLEPCIQVLHRVYDLDHYPIQGLKNDTSFLSSPSLDQAFVAISYSKIIGHVAIGKADDSDLAVKLWRTQHPETSVAVFERLFVDPGSRGSGVAARLIEAAVEWNSGREMRLVLFVLEKDRVAERLYRRMGWKEFGVRAYEYGDGGRMDAMCFVSP